MKKTNKKQKTHKVKDLEAIEKVRYLFTKANIFNSVTIQQFLINVHKYNICNLLTFV